MFNFNTIELMKTKMIMYAVLAFFLFPSCEKEAMEAEAVTSKELTVESKAMEKQKVHSFRAHLTGDQEVPAASTNATGQALFKLSKDGSELSYKLIVANLDNVLMAHIHLAPAGMNGGVVVWLYPSGPPPQLIEGTTNGILVEGVITSGDLVGSLAGGDLQSLLDNMAAGNAYVNVHTVAFPGGEIRGQISANNQ